MNSRKHLNIIYEITFLLLIIGCLGTIVAFFQMINGNGAVSFFICAILSLCLYFSMVFLSTIIDFYDAIVIKHKTENTTTTNTTNSQEQQ